jgi:hypothetical protein
MKFKLTLHKVFEVDTDKDWNGGLETLIEHLKDTVGVKPGEKADADQIHDAIRSMLDDDIGYVIEPELSADDFEIEVPSMAIVKIPEEEEEED